MSAASPSRPARVRSLHARGAALRRSLHAASMVAALSALTGCTGIDRTVTSSVAVDDYRVRHPIVIAKDERKLDVFVAGTGLDRRTAAQIRQFGAQYRQLGQGPITVVLPAGPNEPHGSVVAAIRSSLAAGGASAPVSVATYVAADPALASSIRISYLAISAKVPHGCGEWPSDLGPSANVEEWGNHPYWNLGCATQTALSAQVADPRDLVAPQAETPADTLTRSRGIESIRKGVDPATEWKVKNTSISSVGGS